MDNPKPEEDFIFDICGGFGSVMANCCRSDDTDCLRERERMARRDDVVIKLVLVFFVVLLAAVVMI